MSSGCSQSVDSTAIQPAQWPTYLPSHPAQGWKCKSSLLQLLLLLLLLLPVPPPRYHHQIKRPSALHSSTPSIACTIHAHTGKKSKDDSRKKQRWGSTLLACLGACKESWKDFFLFFLSLPLSLVAMIRFSALLFCSLLFALCSLCFRDKSSCRDGRQGRDHIQPVGYQKKSMVATN